MKNTTEKTIMAVLELAANKPEVKEATAIVERLAQYHIGYLKTAYEWISSTSSHCFVVEFSGRLPFVSINPDICTAIVLMNQRIMSEFAKPEADLSTPTLTALESADLRTEYATAS